ncbi:hypothetical protein [uncultured Mediterranean phage uvMED]|nr:hypothetical protein [uncultured Mediterranean phage uvMED]BAQ89945.1 hypothetical protein [uncultured Mediterranean phage uvMED]BAQ90022.1 hypothetical protein [uncultured Mediterranean phage uvMED]BAQ90071.1 hypothetical protein [uncultured Mediterranean phage uvMED]
MVIESVVMAGAILKQVSDTIGAVNEGRASIETAMGLLADFGAGLNEFQKSKSTGFTKLSNGDVLKLSMIRRSQERYEHELRTLLLAMDSTLLAQYDAAIAENKRRHQEQQRYMARKKKERERLMQQILVGGATLLIGSGIAVAMVVLVIKAFT